MASDTQPDLDMPIALRKPKRRSEAISPVKPRASSDSLVRTKTPSSRRSKRVRFSDPGLFSPTANTAATSLTPAFRRSSLGTPRQKRPATPGRPAVEGFVQFTPFTQILDQRCQRRIRRNGLSDEMNQYEADKKTKIALQKEIDDKDTELQRLRAELNAAKAQPSSHASILPDSPASSQQRVNEVEAELEALRQSFAAEDDDQINTNADTIHSWSHIPHVSGPTSDGGDTILIHEDEDVEMETVPYPSRQITDSDAMRMGLELQAARAAKSNLLGSFRNNHHASFDFQFADSPARSAPVETDIASISSTFQIPDSPPPRPPPNNALLHTISKDLKATTNRAEEAELALTALDIEVTNLGFGNPDTDDTMAMVTAIATHFRSARLELERLVPGENTSGFSNPSVLPELLKKLTLLSDRLKAKEAEVRAAGDQHHNLKGNFEKAIIAAEKANKEIKKLEVALDSAVEETLHSRMRNQELERDLEEKERNVSSLSSALDKYRADISRLETLINEMQEQYGAKDEKVEHLEARVESETTGRRAAEVSAVQRLARINELEIALSTSRRHATDLENQLAALQSTTVTATSPSASFRQAEEVAALQQRITALAASLATATTEIDRLKQTKLKLEERVRTEVEKGAAAVETLQEQLIRSVVRGNEARKRYVNGAKVRRANWELQEEDTSSDGLESEDGPRTPGTSSRASSSASVRFAEWAEVEVVENRDELAQHSIEHDEEPSAAEVEESYDGESGSESVPGSVQIYRGRTRTRGTRYQKKPRLVSFDQARRSGSGLSGLGIHQQEQEVEQEQVQEIKGRRKRRYDSGIGMSPSSEFEIAVDADVEEDKVRGAGVRRRDGMMTPELSSEGDIVDVRH